MDIVLRDPLIDTWDILAAWKSGEQVRVLGPDGEPLGYLMPARIDQAVSEMEPTDDGAER